MSEWRGLHNPERHYSYTGIHSGAKIPTCRWCAATCLPDMACRCCLAHEGLLAQDRAEAAEAERDALRATLRRVRNIQQRYVSVSREEMSQTDALGLIGLALDGGESDE